MLGRQSCRFQDSAGERKRRAPRCWGAGKRVSLICLAKRESVVKGGEREPEEKAAGACI